MTAGFRLDGPTWGPHSGATGRSAAAITYDAATREVTRHIDGRVIGNDIFDALAEAIADDPTALWVGYLGYACRPDLTARPSVSVPDAVWMRVGGGAGVGEPLPEARAQAHSVGLPQEGALPPLTSAPSDYIAAFDDVQAALRAGDTYEVNLTRRVDFDSSSEPGVVYDRLCRINPAPYAAHLWFDGTHVLSASPECFASIRNRRVRTKPIKGTTPRGDDPASDEVQRLRLATDPRYRAENLMITDLMRNDLSQVCVPGSVVVPALMDVESYPAVHQLVSTVEGELRAGVTGVGAIRALFPAGSMTGAPKMRTMEIIDRVEDSPRGVYAGALGWFRGDECELSVVIRTLIRDAGGGWQAGTGGGITVHSDAASEWEESQWKLRRLAGALDVE